MEKKPIWIAFYTRVILMVLLPTLLLLSCRAASGIAKDTHNQTQTTLQESNQGQTVNFPDSLKPPKKDGEVALLGIRLKNRTLATVLVDRSGFNIVEGYVLVPRNDGWWQVGLLVQKQEKPKLEVEKIRTWRANGLAPKESLEPEDPDCDEAFEKHKITTLFIGEAFISTEEEYENFWCGAHNFMNHVLLTRQFVKNESNGSPIDKVLGGAGARKLKKKGEQVVGDSEKTCLSAPDTTDWGVVRIRGAWEVRGGAGPKYPYCRSNYRFFSIGMEAPADLSGDHSQPVDWKWHKDKHSGLRDVVISPSGKMKILVFANRIELYVGGASIDSYEAEKASLVMIKWAEDSVKAREWSDYIRNSGDIQESSTKALQEEYTESGKGQKSVISDSQSVSHP